MRFSLKFCAPVLMFVLIIGCSKKNNSSLFNDPSCLAQAIANVVVEKGTNTIFASDDPYNYYTLYLRRYNGTYKIKVSVFPNNKSPELEVSYYHTNYRFYSITSDDLWFQESVYGPPLLVYVSVANDIGIKGGADSYQLLYRPSDKNEIQSFSPHDLESKEAMTGAGIEEFVFKDGQKVGGDDWWHAKTLDPSKIDAEYRKDLVEIARLLNLHYQLYD